jgi:hypothetical protein
LKSRSATVCYRTRAKSDFQKASPLFVFSLIDLTPRKAFLEKVESMVAMTPMHHSAAHSGFDSCRFDFEIYQVPPELPGLGCIVPKTGGGKSPIRSLRS